MTGDTLVYEPPVLVEVGDFTGLTLGYGPLPLYDGVTFGLLP
ncbi:hypothetical protein F4561_000796 [Lipingzhangella halophila]|uniref:Lasso RiPP family leader peptide-containing protein n=1 Tax=Lipingzhangella halophila TaxID=1783352 RepID=A0A7W7RDG5_9ACTN|nr:lasso RiPP family leader peptide-containing protein [Lipingzhangella halophila]MBB4929976.1 hypothetical protein [Lipingzhangella halophila]